MAWVMYYPVAVAGTYFLGRNILYKGTSYVIDYILNTNADPEIRDTHTVETIKSMMITYKDLSKSHPAYEALQSVAAALKELQDEVDRARLRLSVHDNGWVTRFRTYDARVDNTRIEKKSKELMSRLDIFTKLIRLTVPHNNKHENSNKEDYGTEYTDTFTDHQDIVPVTAMVTLADISGIDVGVL